MFLISKIHKQAYETEKIILYSLLKYKKLIYAYLS